LLIGDACPPGPIREKEVLACTMSDVQGVQGTLTDLQCQGQRLGCIAGGASHCQRDYLGAGGGALDEDVAGGELLQEAVAPEQHRRKALGEQYKPECAKRECNKEKKEGT
jgi:hypothetical protein